MNPEPEIRRLIELMPASGRMFCQIVDRPDQPQVIAAPLPLPWQPKQIAINFELWRWLPKPQRDVLLLRAVCWLTAVQWFRPGMNQALIGLGGVGAIAELVQMDAIGAVVTGGIATFGGLQLWRSQRSPERELQADEAAIDMAQRRGYSRRTDVARHLLNGIESVARLEQRSNLSLTEVLRCQRLRAIAAVMPIGAKSASRRV